MTSELLANGNNGELTDSGRPRRQCRKEHVSYADNNDIDLILEQHLLDHHARSRKRKATPDEAGEIAGQKKRGRKPKNNPTVVVPGIITPNTSTSNEKAKTDETSNSSPKDCMITKLSPSGCDHSAHVINEAQKKTLIASMSNVKYELKFVDFDRLHFEMQSRDDAHLDPDFRKTLVDEWVSTSYDHDFHLNRLMEIAKDSKQKHADSILHTIFVMRGLLNVKKENNLLKLKMKDQLCDRHGCTSKAFVG